MNSLIEWKNFHYVIHIMILIEITTVNDNILKFLSHFLESVEYFSFILKSEK